jgi:hypothetical protein
MADKDTPEFSREEAQGFLFNGAPRQVVAAPVMQTTPSIPVPPPVSVKSVERGAPVAKQPDAPSLVKRVTDANKQLQASVEAPTPPSAMHGLVEELSNNWKPLAIGALAVTAGYGAARLLGGRKSAETPATKQPTQPAAQRIEPTFATPEETAAFKPIDQPSAPSKLAVESEAKFGVPLSDVENHFGVKVTNIKDAEILSNNYKNSLPGAIGNAPSGVPGANPMDQLTTQPPAPQLMQPKPPAGAVAPQPMAAAPAAPTSVADAVATGQNPTQALNESLAKDIDAATPKTTTPVSPESAIKVEGLVRDAQGNFQYPQGMSPAAIQAHKAFVQQYPEIAASLEAQGKFGMVGGGAADNSLHNTYGPELRKTILHEVNPGQMAGINKNYLEKINPAIKALSTETGLGKTLAELRVNNPKGGTKGPLGVPATIGSSGELVSTPPGKVSGLVNKGGKALLLMAMADAAKAAQEGNTAPAKEVGFDLGTGALLSTLFGGPAGAALSLALGSSSLNAGEEKELAKRRASRGIAPLNQR